MVKFEEYLTGKSDHFFVEEDPARIYRDLKDLLVEEFNMDRIEEAKNEFSVSSPKDRIRMHAFKVKSPHTAIHYNLSWKAKDPKSIYKQDRGDILKARVKCSGEVVTVYPGWESEPFSPHAITEQPTGRYDQISLTNPHKSRFQRSKFYRILVGIWYHKFYSKEIDKYIEEGNETILRIQNLMREKFGVEEAIGMTGASEYSPPWK
jgi:hypothetical protein